eukprot:11499459-Alexandrium_andersonii.AAC.1
MVRSFARRKAVGWRVGVPRRPRRHLAGTRPAPGRCRTRPGGTPVFTCCSRLEGGRRLALTSAVDPARR